MVDRVLHSPMPFTTGGQTITDRLNAAKHSLAGSQLGKAICKATTEEPIGPKKKHLDYLLHCTQEPNISIPQMANLLVERCQNDSWAVVFKSLITLHNLMCYGNELLKTLPILQGQIDALLEFQVTPSELTNGVINSSFILLFRDLIRLFACYNDGIINLLEKYFDMNKKQCREALDLYKSFLLRMDRVAEFLKVAESVGIDRGEIPDLAKAPNSLLEALESHLISIEGGKGGSRLQSPSRCSEDQTASAIRAYSSMTDSTAVNAATLDYETRQRYIMEEQKRLDQLKEHAGGFQEQQKFRGAGSGVTSANPFLPQPAKPAAPSQASHVEDLLSLSFDEPTPAASAAPPTAASTNPFLTQSSPFAVNQSMPSNGYASGGSSQFGAGATTNTDLFANGFNPSKTQEGGDMEFGFNAAPAQSQSGLSVGGNVGLPGPPSNLTSPMQDAASMGFGANPFGSGGVQPHQPLPPAGGGGAWGAFSDDEFESTPIPGGFPGTQPVPVPQQPSSIYLDTPFGGGDASYTNSPVIGDLSTDPFANLSTGGLGPKGSPSSMPNSGTGMGMVGHQQQQRQAMTPSPLVQQDLDSTLANLAQNLNMRPTSQHGFQQGVQWSGGPRMPAPGMSMPPQQQHYQQPPVNAGAWPPTAGFQPQSGMQPAYMQGMQQPRMGAQPAAAGNQFDPFGAL